MGNCIGGKQHSEIITAADDADRWDPSVLGKDAPAVVRVATSKWGYCVDCHQGFRWSLVDLQWRPWPLGLAQLPHLEDEELEVLHKAIVTLASVLIPQEALAQAEGTKVELGHLLLILQSLDTAVMEARYSLWPLDGPHKPRAWGEAWDVLIAWLDVQVAGIARSSSTDAGEGATAAFRAVKVKVSELQG